jgi:hypothetical protein
MIDADQPSREPHVGEDLASSRCHTDGRTHNPPRRHPVPFLRRIRPLLLAIGVFIFAFTQFLPAVDDREFHRDEARWIHRSVYVREALDPFGPYWDENTWLSSGASMDEQYRLRAQPPLGSYVMGIGFLVQDGELPDTGFWNMDFDTEWNDAAGNKPTDKQLFTGRRTNAVIGALTVVAVYFIARRVTNDIGGVVSAAFLAAHPLMIYVATFAGSDAVLGLTIALAAVAAYRFADRPSWFRAITLGVVIGLGGAAKLSPLGISAVLAALGAAVLLRLGMGRRTWRWALPSTRTAIQLISTPIVAGITLVASYPYLWRSPVRNTLNLLDYRTLGMELQGSMWEGIGVTGPFHALQRIGRRLGSEMTLAGRLEPGISPAFEMAVAVAGLVILLWLVARRGVWSGTGLIATVLLAETAITVIGMRADWARYHLPVLLLTATCTGIAAGQLGDAIWRLVSSPRTVHPYREPPSVTARTAG